MMIILCPLVLGILMLLFLNKKRRFERVNCSLSGWIGLILNQCIMLGLFIPVLIMFQGFGFVWILSCELWIVNIS